MFVQLWPTGALWLAAYRSPSRSSHHHLHRYRQLRLLYFQTLHVSIGNDHQTFFYNILKIKVEFKVCKSVHHRTIQINQQPDATIFQFIILTFIYSSTCFGRGRAGRPVGPNTNTARLSPRDEGKTRGCYCSRWAPDDGQGNARNMLSCK
jgi:hypothetical protein